MVSINMLPYNQLSGEKVTIASLRGKYYYIASCPWYDFYLIIVLGKDYYIASCPGETTIEQVSINMLPYNQLSGKKVTI